MKTSRKTSALNRCILETLESRQMMAAGDLDKLFSGDGRQTIALANGFALFATDVAVQTDGKTVVAGTFGKANGDGAADFAVARFNFDGTLDKTFGRDKNGIAVAHLSKGGGRDEVNAVVIQPDGRIVVAGRADVGRIGFDTVDFAVARFMPDGSLDNSFDENGLRTIQFHELSEANDVAIQRDGKIVLVGQSFDSGNVDFAIVRLNRDGSLDGSFNGGGKKTIDFGGSEDASGVAIDAAGRIVIVGKSRNAVPRSRFAVARLSTTGAPDSSFNGNGRVLTEFVGLPSASARDIVIQPDGKMVVAGNLRRADGDRFVLARYISNGQLDTPFGTAGSVETPFPQVIVSGVIQSIDGGFVVGGTSNGKFALGKYTATGQLNTSFGNGGKVVTDFGAAGTAAFAGLARGPGRRIVMAGGDLFKTARFLDEGANRVSISASSRSATEGGTSGLLHVRRNETVPIPTRVFFNIGGTASRSDYSATNLTFPSGSPGGGILGGALSGLTVIDLGARPSTTLSGPLAFVDIPAGQSQIDVRVTASNDALLEGTETAIFTIAPNAAYEITPLSTFETVFINDRTNVQINFQTPGASPAGYIADVGGIFGVRGNGLTFGWDADNTANARIRNNAGSPDSRYDTLIKMQDGVDRKWEIALPNGVYEVHLVAGDPSFTDSVYKLNLESVLSLEGTPSGNTRWFERTMWIPVNDGRLTLSNAAGAINNKIAYIDIKAAPVGVSATRAVTDNIPVLLGGTQSSPLIRPPLFSTQPIRELIP